MIDDASSDGSREVLREYQLKDPRLKIFRFEESCKGFTAIRYNFGVKQATGELISYMMDDDVWYPNALETLVQPFLANPSQEMTYAQGQPIDSRTGRKLKIHGSAWTNQIYRDNIVPNPAVLIKKSVFDKIGYADETPEFRRCNDYELWVRMKHFNINVAFIPKVIVEGYVENADSIGRTISVDIKYIQQEINRRYPRK
jgi:glycosyltransferase involved in cell wall biosynthesis